VTEYKRAVAAATPVGRQKTDWFACTPPTLVLDDDREACRYGLRGARFFSESLARYYLSGTRPVGKLDVPRGFFSEREIDEMIENRNQPGSAAVAILGDPSAAKETVARFVDIGVDELICIMQMGTVPHELIMKSLRTFGEKVMPHFA
jgi:alkanesulfonate monooxygenase SsuD/methylene tetrahydromethanopterin reductase-like flavin-dependent oxidoreductase (luciferase family)